MQQAKNDTSTVRLIDNQGREMGRLQMPASARIADLDHLRALGAARAELVPAKCEAELALNRIDESFDEIGRGLGRLAVRAGHAVTRMLTRH